jgi:hypothetical protein
MHSAAATGSWIGAGGRSDNGACSSRVGRAGIKVGFAELTAETSAADLIARAGADLSVSRSRSYGVR